ncbi:MAG: hypothetical protein ACPH5G_18230, partial [Pseudooceanicola atlanticus]
RQLSHTAFCLATISQIIRLLPNHLENKIIGHFTATGVRSHFSERFKMWGYDLPAHIFEPTRMD